ncbi:MAG: hypothetical protein ACRES6_01735 [Steroidobacteraceae bacterium]
MRRKIGSTCVAVAALALAGCGVQVQDETPAQFKTNASIGMYPVTARVTGGMLVSQPVYLFIISKGQKVPLSYQDGTYQTMFPVKCTSSFPLQFLAVWRLQVGTTRSGLFPAQPREITLTPPPLTPEQAIDTSGRPDKKTRSWQGNVQYNFVTAPDAHITGAHLEPVSQDKADVKAAKGISVVSTFPVDATCGTPTAVELASKEQHAHANLVIDTDLPAYPHWTTRVDFAPQSQ